MRGKEMFNNTNLNLVQKTKDRTGPNVHGGVARPAGARSGEEKVSSLLKRGELQPFYLLRISSLILTTILNKIL